MEENRTYIIDHNYGEVQITGLKNALNMYGVLWQHYHQTSDRTNYHEDWIKSDLKKNGYHNDRCGYLAIIQS